jgi:hypothetical protein
VTYLLRAAADSIQGAGIFDNDVLVVDRSIEPRYSGTTSAPLACPTYDTRDLVQAFKAQVVQECSLPGSSVASVALSHGINTNVVHRWRRLAACQHSTETLPAFLPVMLELPA